MLAAPFFGQCAPARLSLLQTTVLQAALQVLPLLNDYLNCSFKVVG